MLTKAHADDKLWSQRFPLHSSAKWFSIKILRFIFWNTDIMNCFVCKIFLWSLHETFDVYWKSAHLKFHSICMDTHWGIFVSATCSLFFYTNCPCLKCCLIDYVHISKTVIPATKHTEYLTDLKIFLCKQFFQRAAQIHLLMKSPLWWFLQITFEITFKGSYFSSLKCLREKYTKNYFLPKS